MSIQALEQPRDSVLRYGEIVGCELLNCFVSPDTGRWRQWSRKLYCRP